MTEKYEVTVITNSDLYQKTTLIPLLIFLLEKKLRF